MREAVRNNPGARNLEMREQLMSNYEPDMPEQPRDGADGESEYLYYVAKRAGEDGKATLIYAWGPDFEEARARYDNGEGECQPIWERPAWVGG